MRLNTPVTNHEYILNDTETIVSTTDLQGNITYANPYFIQVSGYTEEELIGQPQNILRHPDMPAEAFADLWATIRSGEPWTGMVKNRCKNGDFYWVLANITPVIENGRPVGYMSVRTKPGRELVQQTDALYKEIKAGNPRNITISRGSVKLTGIAGVWSALRHLSLQQRANWNLGFLVLLMSAILIQNLLFNPAPSIWLTVLSAVGIATTFNFWHALHRAVIVPLHQALKASQIMAGGDLTQEIDSHGKDDMGQLLRALRQLNINLYSIVGDVRRSSDQTRIATSEIAAGNMDLSERTESQAAALEETASSMNQLAATVDHNTAHAVQANQMAGDASLVADKGGAIVSQVVSTMNDINTSSKKVVDIISLIEGIAFQTNILALNAAVEAARAGEQGRGFAVVATEVRQLAQRSANAAKEIKDLIQLSAEKINAGTMLAGEAGNTMRDIISSVQNVRDVMSEIAAASREQSAGIAKVNTAVRHMDDVTIQNAALVEEAAAAATSLQEQTIKVVQALAVFKLDKKIRR